MSFAKWERMVRFVDETITIFTEVDVSGQVVRACSADGQRWALDKT